MYRMRVCSVSRALTKCLVFNGIPQVGCRSKSSLSQSAPWSSIFSPARLLAFFRATGTQIGRIGIARAKARIGLKNLAYNMRRLVQLDAAPPRADLRTAPGRIPPEERPKGQKRPEMPPDRAELGPSATLGGNRLRNSR